MSLIPFFSREVTLIARDLLGATLLVDGVGGIIVETEAYHPTDPAAHSFIGRTARNASMFDGPGRVYIYRSYGFHWCLNFVCADAAAVLIRAIEPTAGLEIMAERRSIANTLQLCSGPGKVGQALGINKTLDGIMLNEPPFVFRKARKVVPIAIGRRIGISKAVDLPWRFGIAGSPYLSRKFAEPQG